MLRLQSDRKDLDIWLRLESLYHFYWNEETKRIEFDMYHDVNLIDLSKLQGSKPMILLYDVEDGQQFRTDTYTFSTLISTSTRNFSTDFQAIYKSRGDNVMIIEPYSEHEFKAVLEIFDKCGDIKSFLHIEKKIDCSMEKLIDLSKICGAVFRHVLRENVNIRKDISQFARHLHEVKDASVFNLPKGLGQFIAVKFKAFKNEFGEKKLENSDNMFLDSILTNDDNWELCFHSEILRITASKHVFEPAQVLAMRLYGLTYQIQESLVLYGGLLNNAGNHVHYSQKAENWEWFHNSDYPSAIKTAFEEIKMNWPKCTSFCSYGATHLSNPFYSLDEKNVYQSSVVNGALYDFLTLRKDSDTSLWDIHMFQSTEESIHSHTFTLNVFLEVLRKLYVLTESEPGANGQRSEVVDPKINSINFYLINSSNEPLYLHGIRVSIGSISVPVSEIQKWDSKSAIDCLRKYVTTSITASDDVELCSLGPLRELKTLHNKAKNKVSLEVLNKKTLHNETKNKDSLESLNQEISARIESYLNSIQDEQHSLELFCSISKSLKFFVARFPVYPRLNSTISLKDSKPVTRKSKKTN